MNIPTLIAAFASAAHPSPLVAEYYVLGGAEVVRLEGESGYSLDHPNIRSTLKFANKSNALEAGAYEVIRELDRGFAASQETPHDDTDDIEVRDQGSIVLVEPKTPAGRQWISDHVSGDSYWFGNALVVEHRYADPLLCGMADDGLSISM